MSSPEADKEWIGVINAGSSSVKFGLYAGHPTLSMRYRGSLDGIGALPRLRILDADGATVEERTWAAADLDVGAATREVLMAARGLVEGRIVGIGHRVVHGGTKFSAPTRIDGAVLDALEKLTPLAPLHQPRNLDAIKAIAEAAPHISQIACFDTAFHRGQPPVAQLFAIPRKFTEAGVRRYGFHGLSYEFVAGQLREAAPGLAKGRVIVAHLGSGASLCAMRDGRSIASTMGFTAVDGLMMSTRCGAIDPGVLIYLMDTYKMGPREIEDLVYRKSGLLGVSGISLDMRELRASSEPAAAEAIELFVYRAVREIGSLAAGLGGLDGLVFTAGIGENDRNTRAEIAAGCAWLGLEIDPERNAAGAGRISSDTSRVETWVIPTDEEGMIARHTAAALAPA
jgi:acetate kinase